jgi:hypothetical protein
LRSELRSIQRKQKQAINNFIKAVDTYNRGVRTHNSRVRRNRQRLDDEINRLNSKQTVTIRYTTYRTSVTTLQQSFARVEAAADLGTWTAGDDLLDLAEGETANSVALLNALFEEPATESSDDHRLRQTVITNELHTIDPDLDARWKGALYALSPSNPDAARHFCTSTREIFIRILDLKAPDEQVLAATSNVKRTETGQVPRREKIRYCLERRGRQNPELLNFVDDNIDNVMDLFAEFNPATHGEAGRYDLAQLSAIKTRVEGAIQFLYRIVVD